MFVLDEFKELVDLAEMHDYASRNLELLTEWSEKNIYKIDSDRVLKIANNDDGILSISNEFHVSSKYATEDSFPKNIITKVFEKHDMSSWIMSEICYPISPNELKDILSIDFNEFCMFLGEFSAIDEKPPENISAIIDFLKEAEISLDSLTDLESWGKRDSQLKLNYFGKSKIQFQKRKKRYSEERPKSVYSNFEF